MKDRNVSRREFLRNSALGFIGAGIAGRMAAETLEADKEKNQSAGPAKVKTFRKLGRTGFMTTDLGSGQPTSAAVLNALLDAGVNYIDGGCQERCPYDVPIRGLLTLAHQRLSIEYPSV